jgi:hypothetical protein
MATPSPRPATFADLIARAAHDRLEIIGGELVEKAMPSPAHAAMRAGVLMLLLAACGGNSGGSAAAPMAPSPAAPPAAAPAAAAAPPRAAAAAAAADPAWPAPVGWRTEVIKFPLDFAPSIAHRGFEGLRFPPGFFDPASGDYWSYTFIWRTEDPARLDAVALGAELTAYFRGLVAAVDEKRHRIASPGEIAARAVPDGAARFQLSAHVFDAFKTAAPVDLIGFAERRPCRAGALWVFVLAPATTRIRPQLEELARAARCAE